MKKILIIQTAFIGDVILATSLIDLIKNHLGNVQIDFLLRKGNESLLENHKNINNLWVWDKKGGKYKNLFSLVFKVRKEKYDYVINIQRFFNSGLFTALSGGKIKVGFKQNPMSFFFDKKIEHKIPYPIAETFYHEVQRNALLYKAIDDNYTIPMDAQKVAPSLTISKEQNVKIVKIVDGVENYIVLAPTSVWFTKQWAKEQWIKLSQLVLATEATKNYKLYFIGAPADSKMVDEIMPDSDNCINLCGKLSLVESAALMQNAKRVFVNDSAPLHLASSVNAKTTAIFCSTVTDFGYTPIADDAKTIQLSPRLECMPCGLHGKKECPLGHFKCAFDIDVQEVYQTIND